MTLLPFVLCTWLATGCLSALITVQDTEKHAMLFSTVILKCDYSTSAQIQDVLVTWLFKSFCKDPIFDYYSADYQAGLQLGQDPSNDCNDNQRTVRIVVQKQGQNEPMLGMDYRQRKITIQNKADLVISEVMWWDHGVYFCSLQARGDTSGDMDKEVKMIVLHWLTVLFIVLGGLLLILLLSICWCQCCPQCCCCYVQCPCCPTRCCCPEKAIARHRYMKQAEALFPWVVDQPMYAGAANSKSSSYQLNPLLQQDISLQNSLPVMRQASYPPSTNRVLDFLETEIKNLNTVQPAGSHYGGGHQQSVLSSLGDIGVRNVERRVIQLPPIEHIIGSQRTSNSSQQRRNMNSWDPLEGDRDRRRNRSLEDSYSTEMDWREQDRHRNERAHGYRRETPSGGRTRRDPSPYRRHDRDYHSDDSIYDDRRGRSNVSSARTQNPNRRASPERGEQRSGRSPDRHSRQQQRRRSLSPPHRRGSWSSEDEREHPRGRRERRDYEWPEKPPSYKSIDVTVGKSSAHRPGTGRQSDRASSRSGRSMVI
ncbi:immunoglobulin-like domain-containing receptor 1 [Spea bombifrons]|uniref:immunoglobulin-like domain-containing receptor 1 n=1 Tax=Spea bombifrons TaxID=233779 RepID=UPI00234BC9CD|nr:immunoglobulin-like domain-containing receptor 1 [Spea bombifrons]